MQHLSAPNDPRPEYRKIIFQVFIWLIVLLFPLLSYNIRVLDSAFYVKECINTLFIIGLFYLHMRFLIPRFFASRKLIRYAVWIFGSILFIVAEQETVEYATFRRVSTRAHQPYIVSLHARNGNRLQPNTTQPIPQHPDNNFAPPPPPPEWRNKKIAGMPAFIFVMTLRKALFSAFLILLASGFIKTALEWFKTQRRQEELEKEKLNAELDFLKQQVNPHFLFNSLNSIYALTQRKAEEASEAVMQLSQMMRYMIYESNTSEVVLAKELDYLDSYMNLKKLRLSHQVTVHYEVTGDITGLYIEPMLLIPFIENAFKHGVSYTEKCDIHIKINVGQRKLDLLVSNKIYRHENTEPGGIGLSNVTKRLDMLYPGHQHLLNIIQENNKYTVSLSLQLKDSI